MLGKHYCTTYSKAQDIIALSSEESVFYGIAEAGGHALGSRAY